MLTRREVGDEARPSRVAQRGAAGKVANDLIYAFDASRFYDPAPHLEKIAAPSIAINSAADQVNPPELGILGEQTARVANGSSVVLPITPMTRGHGTHAMPTIPDDPVTAGNRRGRVAFAMTAPDTRSTQVFIDLADNSRLDGEGSAPFGEVVAGMDVVEWLYPLYGEEAGGGMRGADARARSRMGERPTCSSTTPCWTTSSVRRSCTCPGPADAHRSGCPVPQTSSRGLVGAD